MSAPGRPKRELRALREVVHSALRCRVGRHPRSQSLPAGLGFALLVRASLGGQRSGDSRKRVGHR